MIALINIIGWLATILAAGMTIPQSWKAIKHKKIEGVSFATYVILLTGFMLWVLQSSLVQSYQGFMANTLAILLTIPVIYMIYKLKPTKKTTIIWNILIVYFILVFAFSILILAKNDIFSDDAKSSMALAIGIVAGIFSTFSFFPQVIQEFKTKKVSDQSLITILAFGICNLFWLIHFSGRFWYIEDITFGGVFPLFLWGGITFLLQTVYATKIIHKRKKAAL